MSESSMSKPEDGVGVGIGVAPSPNESKLSDLLTSGSPRSVTSAPSSRERRRAIERKARAKHKNVVAEMRQRVVTLECVAAELPQVVREESEQGTKSHAPPDRENEGVSSLALRSFLRRSRQVEREAQQLREENSELKRMVQKHVHALVTLRLLTRGMEVDPWTLGVERWRATTREYFTHWSLAACAEVIQESLQIIQTHSFEDGPTVTTGLSFMGWRDRRRLDTKTGSFHFSFAKTYRGMSAATLSQVHWDVYMDEKRYVDTMIAPNAKCYYEIIQRVTSDIAIARSVGQYPEIPVKMHMLLLMFRVRTPTGFVQVARSIPCPRLERATVDDDAVWATNFYWGNVDDVVSDDGELHVRHTVNGTFKSSTADLVAHLMGELLVTLVRAECKTHGMYFLGR